MNTREKIITGMCYTWRHDYGLEKDDNYTEWALAGMTNKERIALWNTMAQIFDNNIAPYMEFKNMQG